MRVALPAYATCFWFRTPEPRCGEPADDDFPVLPPPPNIEIAAASVGRSSGVLTVTCPHCGARNTFSEFDEVDIFVWDECQEPVRVIGRLQ
jgi:hypothetical protein